MRDARAYGCLVLEELLLVKVGLPSGRQEQVQLAARDRVADVKVGIEPLVGIPVDYQELQLGTIALNDDATLEVAGITTQTTLSLRARVCLTVRLPQGVTLQREEDPDCTVAALIRKLQAHVPGNGRQRLMLGQQRLDDSATLRSLKIPNGSEMLLVDA